MTNKVRKTPCQNCRHNVKGGTPYWWCNGCGEWTLEGGRAVRPAHKSVYVR